MMCAPFPHENNSDAGVKVNGNGEKNGETNGETNGGYGMTQHDGNSGQRDASHGQNGEHREGDGVDFVLQHPESQSSRAQMVGRLCVVVVFRVVVVVVAVVVVAVSYTHLTLPTIYSV